MQQVVDLDSKVAQYPWTMSMFLEELRLQSFCRVALDVHGLVIGYGVSRLQVDEWHLLTLGVGVNFRRQGYGECLVADVIRKSALHNDRIILLEVRASNILALNLYKKMGFKIINVRKGYYRSELIREDAIVMERLVQKGD